MFLKAQQATNLVSVARLAILERELTKLASDIRHRPVSVYS